MPTIRRVTEYQPGIRDLLAQKASAENQRRVASEMADAIANATRLGKKVLLASDSDGTMTPFTDIPLESRVDPTVVKVFAAYAPIAEEWVITGGDVTRTAVVLGESGTRVKALCNYGAETIIWENEQPLLSFHPRSDEISPFLEEIADELDHLIAPHLSLSGGERAVVGSGEEAIAHGRVFGERKGITITFHPKGKEKAPEIENLVNTYVPIAVENVKSRWRAAVDKANPAVDMTLVAEAAAEVHLAPGNSGNLEVAWELGISKYSAMSQLVDKYEPAVVIFSGDDTGDKPAIQKLVELRETGTATFFINVANAPEPEKGRVGARQELLELCDASVFSPRELGEFYADVLRIAAERNPDLNALQDAARQLPGQGLEPFLAR